MRTNIVYVKTLDDKEDVVHLVKKYNLLAIPVLDTEMCMVGIVTVDDAMDVLQEENTEDLTLMAAISPSEETYFGTSVLQHAKNRITWLLVLMLSATITGAIITHYESAFAMMPILVSFLPMLMNTGGNCGCQSSTLIIRSLALAEVNFSDFFRIVFKEFRISLIISIVLSTVNGLRIYLIHRDLMLSLVVSLSLIATIVTAKIIGVALPLLAKKVNLDPAIMAAPLITTIVDATSITVYFSIAVKLFGV